MPHVPLFVSDKYKGKTGGLYGDVIAEIDWSVGQILDAVKRAGIDNNTLVIFTSDNGPWLSYGNHAGIGRAVPRRQGDGVRGRRAGAVRRALAGPHPEGHGGASAGDDHRSAADDGEARRRARSRPNASSTAATSGRC